MIVVMEPTASEAQIAAAAEAVRSLGLKANVIQGTERTVIAAIGDERDGMQETLAGGPGVSAVMPVMAPYKLASREVKPEATQIKVGHFAAGAGVVGVIAGPCSVEGEEQILSSARAVKAAGATALRGGGGGLEGGGHGVWGVGAGHRTHRLGTARATFCTLTLR